MKNQNNTVSSNETAEAIIAAVTDTGTSPAIEGNVVAIDSTGKAIAPQAPLPGTEAALATVKPVEAQGVVLVINPEIQVNKAVEVFHLESEVVGRPSIRKSVNKKGAVRIDLETAKELGKALNLKGDTLKKHVQDLGLGLKSIIAKSITELQGDATWVGKHMTMGADGKTATFQLKKVEPVVLAAPAAVIAPPVITDEMVAAHAGISVEDVISFRKDKEAKEAAAKAAEQTPATPEAPAAE